MLLLIPAVACGLIFPDETPRSQYTNVNVYALDILRHAMKFYLTRQKYKQCLVYCKKLADLNEAYGAEQGMCRMLMAITLLQLKLGDIVEV